MQSNNGFSLVELAIVLVIIGLIVGGILTGQDLIHASELNRTYAEINKVKTAMNTFRIKYNQLPGDINNGNSYWASSGNGNGNGRIDNWANETTYLWNHLQNSGLYQNSTGTATTYMPTPMSGDYFYVYYNDLYSCQSPNENAITLHGGLNATTGSAHTVAWTTDDALSVDGKYDDGLPNTGRMRGCDAQNTTGAAVTQTCVSSGAYTNLGLGTERCKLMFY